ncbi:MAG: ABC transporter permease [Clostridia bacterium]
MDNVFIIGLLQATLRMATPILLAALGCLIAERAGILNIGLEGQMLCGAFFGYLTVYFGGSLWLGMFAAGLSGVLLGLVFAYLTVTKLNNQMIVGAAFNMFALGITGFIYKAVVGVTGTTNTIPQFKVISIPLLSKIPIIGKLLFEQNILVYLTLLIVPVIWFVLWKTSYGYELRAIGEHPSAVDSLGIDVIKYKYIAVILQGMLAAFGGAYLTLAYANAFVENLSAGRGFIAMAVVIFGSWNPFGALLGSLVFGFADAFQMRMQSIGIAIPYHFMLMLPYVLTVLILAGFIKKAKPPAMETVPYKR